MNSAEAVDRKIAAWKNKGLTKAEMAAKIAEACLGWPYIFGARGQLCTPAFRKQRANATGGAEGNEILKKCQACNGKTCSGCKWYPSGLRVRSYDCRGFTYWTLLQVGIKIVGQGATSQWNTASNWTEKGDISKMPLDKVCCVFWADKKNPKKMGHTGLYIGNGIIIHCSGEVKRGKPTDKGWTNYAIPAGMDGSVPGPDPSYRPTLRNGDKGEYVTLLQTKLIQLGYDVGPTGADGKYGAKTTAAVRKFQHDRGLVEDGICGDDVWNALDNPTELYTVTVQHVSRSVAESIINLYGGSMKAEG